MRVSILKTITTFRRKAKRPFLVEVEGIKPSGRGLKSAASASATTPWLEVINTKIRLGWKQPGFIYSSSGNPLCFKPYTLCPFNIKRFLGSFRNALSKLVRGGFTPNA